MGRREYFVLENLTYIIIMENNLDIMIIAYNEIKPQNGKIPDESLLHINRYNHHTNNLDDE